MLLLGSRHKLAPIWKYFTYVYSTMIVRFGWMVFISPFFSMVSDWIMFSFSLKWYVVYSIDYALDLAGVFFFFSFNR